MKPFNQARAILEQIREEQYKLDKAISNGDSQAQKISETKIRNLKKSLARLD